MKNLIPLPVSVIPANGAYLLSETSQIWVEPGDAEVAAIGQYLADRLRPSTGYALPVVAAAGALPPGQIHLTTTRGDPTLGEEGYELSVTPQGITLVASQPAGLFRGIQTLRQLLPPAIEQPVVQAGPWPVPAGAIRDYPRFGWRGAMLDVGRHFFPVETIKRYIDLLAGYKINRLHLGLTNDQGWRIAIQSWPRLAAYGGSTQVGGGPGGYYTQAEYAELVAYAQSRYITLIPEIDLPSHTNAALASYAELNCDEVAPPLYTGIDVGFSSLCIDKELTYKFVEDVVREVAALTPGAYIHIGGDEAKSTPKADYIRFIKRAQSIVQALGKSVIGWEEIAQADLLPSTVAQIWNGEQASKIAQLGIPTIMSPGERTYLDMKYDADTSLGLNWAGYVSVRHAYEWDPAQLVTGLDENKILGIEAALWSETLQTLADIEYMAFPRLPGLAEIGWSAAAGRNWDEYKYRLAAQQPRLKALRVNYYPSPEVPWP
jgi:hexosaminidase